MILKFRGLIFENVILRVIFVLLISLYSFPLAFSNVTSNSGNVSFDVDNDGQSEFILNSTGLGVGQNPSNALHVGGNSIISGRLSIGTTTSSSSNLNVAGSIGLNVGAVSSNLTLESSSLVMADSSSGNLDLTLPSAANKTGIIYWIKKVSMINKVRVYGGGTNLDNEPNIVLSSGNLGHLQVMSDGSQWRILSVSGNVVGNIPLVKVDLNNASNITESGFESQNSSSVTHSTVLGDLTGTVSDIQGNFDRGASPTSTYSSYTDLYRDFYYNNSSLLTLTLSGPAITPSADYLVTLYAYDEAETRTITYSGVSGTSGTIGPMSWTANTNIMTLDAFSSSGTITADSSGNITLRTTSTRPRLNAYEVELAR